MIGIFGKARGVVITDSLKTLVHIGAGEDLVIAKAVICAVTRPCKFAGVLMAGAPAINPACL